MSDTVKVFFNRETAGMWIDRGDGTTEMLGSHNPAPTGRQAALSAVTAVMAARGMARTSDWLIVPGVTHVRYCTATTNSSN